MKKLIILVVLLTIPATAFALGWKPNYDLIACYQTVGQAAVDSGLKHPFNGGDRDQWQAYLDKGYADCQCQHLGKSIKFGKEYCGQ